MVYLLTTNSNWKMSFSERNLKLMKQTIKKPYGLILVVGPTGSGKTIMTAEFLKRFAKENSGDKKLVTCTFLATRNTNIHSYSNQVEFWCP